LNVSRSALQNDGFVGKVADYISKKVADKLNGMFKTDRENYEKYWDDISPFIKFGCLKDEKFGKKVKDSILYKNLEHSYVTLEEYIQAEKEAKGLTDTEEQADTVENTEAEAGDAEKKESEKLTVYYVTDEQQQSQYVKMFKEQGQQAVVLNHNIDTAFVTYMEQQNEDIKFQRIDADVLDALKEEVSEEEKENFQKTTDSLVEIFRKELNNDKLEVKVENLKDENVASMAVLSEESRRMQEMMKMYGMAGMDPAMFGGQATLILNANHPLVKFVVEHKRSKSVPIICKQLYDLAMLAHKPLNPEEMTAFVQRSNEIMMLLTK
jgi:molecular chaperone HtpG